MDLELTKNFFIKLSERFWKENALSDITWVLMENIDQLKRDFLNLFGFNIPKGTAIECQREFIIPKSNLRVDFAFSFNNNIFLLENKIWDYNYHIKKYSFATKNIEEFQNVYLGIITNHCIRPSNEEKNIIKKFE